MNRSPFYRFSLSLVLLCSLWACGNAQSSQPPQIAIRVPLGESVDVDGIKVSFNEIREDSRCPRYTTCVWEGRARVIIQVTDEQENTKEYMIFIGATRPDESDNKVIYRSEEVVFEVLDLKPYPGDDEAEEESPVLLITKKEQKD